LKSSRTTILPVIAIIAALIILYPTFGERELQLAIKPEFKQLPIETKDAALKSFAEKWKSEYDVEGEWSISPKPTDWKTEDFFLSKGSIYYFCKNQSNFTRKS
jgi:preprotein translocase subunit SecD